MKETYNLEFCFKGSRTYVQGPDIFDAVIETIKKYFDMSNISDIKYAAHDMLYANANLIVTDLFSKNDFDEIKSVINFKINDIKYYGVVIQNETKIECTHDYSEEIVRTKSVIKENKIFFENNLDVSLTELIVSMNKYFLQNTVTEDGKWIVTKFEYNNLRDLNVIKGKEIQLELTNNFNNKLTKSIVKIDDNSVGFIYFSLV